jgi:hypothetical protein
MLYATHAQWNAAMRAQIACNTKAHRGSVHDQLQVEQRDWHRGRLDIDNAGNREPLLSKYFPVVFSERTFRRPEIIS